MKNVFADEKQTRSLLFFVVILALLSSCMVPASTNSPLQSETTIPMPTVTAASLPTNTPGVRLSLPGKYEGYSQPLYNERTSSSQYITMRDGTKLAALILRPAQDGKTVSTPLPVIWTHNRYHREGIFAWPWLRTLVKHGYVMVSVDVRGSGASYGTYRGLFSPEETRDAYDITEWLAAQPWSNGNIGMFGRSYLGIHGGQHSSAALEGYFPRNG
jgi:predicted acyl esterase